MLLLLLLSCADKVVPPTPVESATPQDTPTARDSAEGPLELEVQVQVTLDGAPLAGAVVSQGGNDARWLTDDAGRVTATLDLTVEGERVLMASWPTARIDGQELRGTAEEMSALQPIVIALESYQEEDNLLYEFQDPGEPERNFTTAQCAHCHVTINQDWFASPHARSASNPVVHDLYAGAAAALNSRSACDQAGGRWWTGLQPGTRAPAERCYLGHGALPDLNPECGDTAPCDDSAESFGACADCHAPGIDGELGGRDLLQATGLAHDYGVHCDVCHKVESVHLEEEAGVAGRLRILRPSEEISGILGPWAPLTFGPYDDVINVKMGSVQRDHYREATLCAGCHQLDQPALVPGQSLDTERWPQGRIPVHSTYEEWQAGPMSPDVVCQSCHMPTDGWAGNSADLGNELTGLEPGMATGWYRSPGQVRKHAWYGPGPPESHMLELAAGLDVQAELQEDALVVQATVSNIGPGHALPTGEPLRHLLLLVQASCQGQPIAPIGGHVVPDYGGALASQDEQGDWSLWPDAQVGDRLRVVQDSGQWLDYSGFGPFGDGRFSAQQKGLMEELLVGQREVLSVDGDGRVTLDAPLPQGDRVYRVRGDWPSEGQAAQGLAGAPGFGFARVLADADGARMVPHHRAVDVVSDNRLMPQQRWTSEHRFAAGCGSPQVSAALVYRPWPLALAQERGWTLNDRVILQAQR